MALQLALGVAGYRASQSPAVQPQALRSIPSGLSVAKRTENQAAPGVMITYFSLDTDTDEVWADATASWQRKLISKKWARVDGPAGASRFMVPPTPNSVGNQCRYDHKCTNASSRCGFSWDDAAAKMNPACEEPIDCNWKFNEPRGSWPEDANWTCFGDLPTYGRTFNGVCTARQLGETSDAYCTHVCSSMKGYDCDHAACVCKRENTSGIWNPAAPIQAHDDSADPKDLPWKNSSLVAMVLEDSKRKPSGLPACRWKPGKKKTGCTNTSQYECYLGESQGQCSGTSWVGNPDCSHSCVHVSLLTPAPYYALWVSGVEVEGYREHERRPGYRHDPAKLTLERRGIQLEHMDVMMSRFCRSEENHFVGVALYSPAFRDKAARLVRSCERNGVCCKAMELSASAFGAGAAEGSDEYRFAAISVKPAFILSQLEATSLPVVYLDADLEFHSFPKLFLPGSWPGYGRDVALFNFWGNESDPQTQRTPQIGSALAFFNATTRARHVLTAWAEAMAWAPNSRVPDDQVLSLLLSEGGWLKRASYGWLPSSYLRLMPSFYRGVVPIVDHDHGSAPGKHSSDKPRMPPIRDMELCSPNDPSNQGRKRFLGQEEAAWELQQDLCRASQGMHHYSPTAKGCADYPPPAPSLPDTAF
jgi:hypothetical protein